MIGSVKESLVRELAPEWEWNVNGKRAKQAKFEFCMQNSQGLVNKKTHRGPKSVSR